MSNKEEQQYLNILEELITAEHKDDRTGTGTNSLFCRHMRFDLSKSFPLLTTKKVFWKGVAVELLWFLSGSTNIKYLVDNDVHIWDEWPYADYCKKNKDSKLSQEEFIEKIKNDQTFADKWGSIGDGGYGAQWRDYGGEYKVIEGVENSRSFLWRTRKGFDQISWLINEIKTNPNSRRLLVWAYNPKDHNELKKAVLPPCHMGFQVVVMNNKLNLVFTMR